MSDVQKHVHNHGPEEGPGLACRESLIGQCMRDEFEALLDALEGMARATADAMVEETGNAEYADWRQWLTAQADALLRKHGRM